MFKYLVLLAVCVAAASAGGIVGIGPGLPSGPWGGAWGGAWGGPVLGKGQVLAGPVISSPVLVGGGLGLKGDLW